MDMTVFMDTPEIVKITDPGSDPRISCSGSGASQGRY